jgi:hypothetical protein
MRHGFRTQSRTSRHPDGKPGLLQIYQFSKQKLKKTPPTGVNGSA